MPTHKPLYVPRLVRGINGFRTKAFSTKLNRRLRRSPIDYSNVIIHTCAHYIRHSCIRRDDEDVRL